MVVHPSHTMGIPNIIGVYMNPSWIKKTIPQYEYYTRWGPPSDVSLDSPHEYYSYLRTMNHSEIGVMCTNLAIVAGGPTLYTLW